MDWDRIRIFLEVARTGQILGAARRLGVNHATVARQLTALERELKTQLVERRTTDWGTTFLPASLARLPRNTPTCSFNLYPCRGHSRCRGGRPTLRSRWTVRSRAGLSSKSSPTTRSASMAPKAI